MPVLFTHQLGYQFADGHQILNNINCSMTATRVGLVGKNGCGKSLLVSLFTEQETPTSGYIRLNGKVSTYSQLPSDLLLTDITIAEYLDISDVLNALKRIEQGECSAQLFDLIGEQWQLESELLAMLSKLGLPQNPDLACNKLSGGQLARIQLWKLFQSQADLLVLDEPSNHLDSKAKAWLINEMQNFPGHIMLVSHDRSLLREMEQIWELSSLGLIQYGGNYDFYAAQKAAEIGALERQIASVQKQQKHVEAQAQKNREKAQQRATQGNRMRKDGSQPKILLDGMKNSAELSESNRLKNERGRTEMLAKKSQSLQTRYEQVKAQKLHIDSSTRRNTDAFFLQQAVLPYVANQALTFSIASTSRVHVVGANGSGKSTLMKVLQGQVKLTSGELRVNTKMHYLDQDFGLLNNQMNLLDTMRDFCDGLLESDARTLLAGVGFRKDAVFRLVADLSGGEKMKLSMLVVTHQPEQPFLLLDEPDNHLDLDSKRLLAQALSGYLGGFALVSHDEDFVQECGTTTELVLG